MSSPAPHRFASSPDGAGRCVHCGGRGAEPQHRRPAKCVKTGPHGSHGACPGRDFPADFRILLPVPTYCDCGGKPGQHTEACAINHQTYREV